MAGGARDRVALFVGVEAGDIVHLQADRMAEAVREEGRGDGFGDHGFRTHAYDLLFGEHAGEQAMRFEMQFRIVLASAHLCAQLLLHAIDTGDQGAEVGITIAVGAGDVGGVAMHLRAGVDQERAMFARAIMALVLVMQHRRVFVQADDVGVGQIEVVVTGGFEIGAMDLQLRTAAAEGRFRSTMPAHRACLRQAHAGEFVVGLGAACEVER